MKIIFVSILIVAMIGVMVPSVEGLTDEEWKEVIRKAEMENMPRMSPEDLKTKFLELEFLHEELQKRIMEQTHQLTYDQVNEHGNAGAGVDIVADKFSKSWDHLFEAENYWFESDGLLIFASVQVKNYSVEAEDTLNEIEQALTKVQRSLIASERLWLEAKNYVHPNMNSDGTVPLWIPEQRISEYITYTNQKYGFSIEIPTTWEINELDSYDGEVTNIVSLNSDDGDFIMFYKEKGLYAAPVNHSLIQQNANSFILALSEECNEMRLEIDGMICGNLELLEVYKGNVGEIESTEIFFSFDYEDSEYVYSRIGIGEIWNDPLDSTSWMIFAQTNEESRFFDDTFTIIDSINITKSIPKSVESEITNYVNDEYGFSFTPPKGWYVENFESLPEFELQSVPVGMQPIVSYTYTNSNAEYIVPTLFVTVVDTGVTIDLDDRDFSAEQVAEGFLNGMKTSGSQAELLSSNVEKIPGGVHIEAKADLKMNLGLTKLFPTKIDYHGWLFENGVIVYYMYMAEDSDYNRFLPEFRDSVDTFFFKPRVVEQSTQSSQNNASEGGGCLIATAAYGTEMAPQVQFLRELRDNTVLQTTSGTAFMNTFNQFYYSFSPQIADYERENPFFKEMVKVTLTPLLTSLTLLNYVEIDSEEEMLGYGIGIILLDIGMYFVAPAILIISVKKVIFEKSPK
tara:strand:- start:32 stop:2080 length:2049 start_codon:yes stop_codon:yes gene_type:complete